MSAAVDGRRGDALPLGENVRAGVSCAPSEGESRNASNAHCFRSFGRLDRSSRDTTPMQRRTPVYTAGYQYSDLVTMLDTGSPRARSIGGL